MCTTAASVSLRAVPPAKGHSVKLKPADPFDLIRWLARSQNDPRKALAELVQNSIDANARRVRIERRRVRRHQALIVRDDGDGVIADLPREEALRQLATNIGHSRKRNLSAQQRHDEVVAGKYGIGLLGFWSIGHRMDIRTRVRGSDVWVLRLVEDQDKAEILRERMSLEVDDTFTEVVITEMHESAGRLLSVRRMVDYLGAELRGSVLASGVDLSIFDGMARGTSQKQFAVVPRRFTGEPLNLPSEIPVPDHAPIRVELHLARGLDRPAIEVACSGTLVADDIAELRALGLDQTPWVGRNLVGLVDFPGFSVPPGTRRGVAPDAAAEAFVRALDALVPRIAAELKRLDHERSAVTSKQVVQDLRKALRGLRNRLPQYELPAVDDGDATANPAPGAGIVPAGKSDDGDDGRPDQKEDPDPIDDDDPLGDAVRDTLQLFPPGPLVMVKLTPSEILIAPGRERRARAQALDADARQVTGEVTFVWKSADNNITVRGEGRSPAIIAAATARPGSRIPITVTATQGAHSADGLAHIVIIEAEPPLPGPTFGIPEPELVDDSGGQWRSRFDGQRWQVNASHEDYVSLHAEPRPRLRYLLGLLAKEIALRTHGVPGCEAALEGMIEILAHAERNLSGV